MPLTPYAIKSVCVYCGSSDAVDETYKVAARDLGQILAGAGLRLIYGGGGVGLMGEVARSAHEAGGSVLGIMPKFLRSRERLFDAVETRVVTSMHERKLMMYEEADAFVVLPGGIGTLEEVVELLSWRRLDLHEKPIVFLDTGGFWAPFYALVDKTVATHFTPDNFYSTYSSVATPAEVLDAIARMKASDLKLDTRKA